MSITVASSIKMIPRSLITVAGCVFILSIQSGCPLVGGASDVPCLNPTAWPNGTLKFLVRPESASAGSFLLGHQTGEQSRADREDGVTGKENIGPVYRFDPSTGQFELFGRADWDSAEGAVQTCSQSQYGATSFRINGVGIQQTLEFDGRTVSVRGGKALSVHRAPRSLASAVASATGGGSPPWITSGGASGQHYHQLFSEVDGSPIGDPVRIGVGAGIGGERIFACWTKNEQYVLYVEPGNRRFQRICVVPITDPLPQPPEQQTEEEPGVENAGP